MKLFRVLDAVQWVTSIILYQHWSFKKSSSVPNNGSRYDTFRGSMIHVTYFAHMYPPRYSLLSLLSHLCPKEPPLLSCCTDMGTAHTWVNLDSSMRENRIHVFPPHHPLLFPSLVPFLSPHSLSSALRLLKQVTRYYLEVVEVWGQWHFRRHHSL